MADLQGADLRDAELQGAALYGAKLQGADLRFAKFSGAVLDDAELQGQLLDDVSFEGAQLKEVCAWRASWQFIINGPKIRARVVAPRTSAKDTDSRCNWTSASYEALKKTITEYVYDDRGRKDALERAERLNPKGKALVDEKNSARSWIDLEHVSPSAEVHEKSSAEQWRETVCAGEGAPYVLRTLLARLIEKPSGMEAHLTAREAHLIVKLGAFSIGPLSSELPALAAAFLGEGCAGARGLTADEIAKLKAIRDRPLPPGPEP